MMKTPILKGAKGYKKAGKMKKTVKQVAKFGKKLGKAKQMAKKPGDIMKSMKA